MRDKPCILVFAGPNGSGKSTITQYFSTVGVYSNADDLKRNLQCTDLEAAELVYTMRKRMVEKQGDFTFETVMSTRRYLDLLRNAKSRGYFIKVVYVLTNSDTVNVARVRARVAQGGHDVPVSKIKSRYHKSLELLPELVSLSDICHIYDNTDNPVRIFRKKSGTINLYPNIFWSLERIADVTGICYDSKHSGKVYVKPMNLE